MGESGQTLTVTVERSGDTESHVVVLIATRPIEGTASGTFCMIYYNINGFIERTF